MSDFQEEDVLRRLERLGAVEPPAADTRAALERLRQTLDKRCLRDSSVPLNIGTEPPIDLGIEDPSRRKSMAIAITCPSCKASYDVGDNMRGKKMLCRECERALIITTAGKAKRDEGTD